MKSRKTNKTSMSILKFSLLIPYSKAQNQTELGFNRMKKYGIENGLLKQKKGVGVCMCEFGVCVCVCLWEALMNRF
jgi:hypothetical protein